ncbi:MAG: hypothetical protein ABIO88_11915, partial [Burkholderiaceae bacterium]
MKYRKHPLCIALLLAMATPLAAAQETTDPGGLTFHLGGYADVTYANSQGAGEVATLNFSPIFHFQVGARVLIEAELETEANSKGERTAAWEYAAVNVLLGDNAALVVGKFLSPTGYFFPNMHPSWINKMPSAPAGFGHGGAAPLTEVGVQLRGGKTFANGQGVNYVVYVGNGPSLGLEGEDFNLEAEGSISNDDGKHVWGCRIGWIPRPGVELGLSLARGGVRLAGDGAEMEMGVEPPAEPLDLSMEPSRGYSVDGVDGAWRVNKSLELRGEWIRQRVGAAQASALPMGATWRAWYTQGTYRFGGDRWEAVARYGQSRSPHAEATFDQFALGVNRLLSSHSQLKLAWEFNDSEDADAGSD